MSKRLVSIIFLLLGFLIGAGLIWLVLGMIYRQEPPHVSVTESVAVADTGNSHQLYLRDLAIDIAEYLKIKDFEALGAVVHPEYNLVFSPYATINIQAAKCFSADEVKALGNNKTVYAWGVFDGTSKTIEMTFDEYYEVFVYDKDYAIAPIISTDVIVESGNALENINEVFPDAQFVEFHYPNSSGDNFDWSTLRLVFERYNEAYALTAIVHSAWTA